MIFLFLLLAVSAFLIGFFFGAYDKPVLKVAKIDHDDSDIIALQKEYENFLSYDGTEQS